MKPLRRLLTFIVTLLVLLLACTLYLLQAAISDQPWVAPAAAATPQQVYQIKALAKRTLPLFKLPSPSTIGVSQTELNHLAALAARAYPRLHSQLRIDTHGVLLSASFSLPDNPFGKYLSLRLRLPVSSEVVKVEQLQLGSLSIPDKLLQPILTGLLRLLFDAEQQQILLQTVRLTATTQNQLSLFITPPTDASLRLRQLLQRIQNFSGDNTRLNHAQISVYYQLLQQQAAQLEAKKWVSMTYFIAPLFRQVAQHQQADQLHLEARSALLALALYLGSDRFEQLTGPVLTPQQRLQRPHYRTLLRGRIDLRQHFVYSAAIQVLADAGFSHAIGEFKELLDSREGGSGFSFADLAADRAGTLFAQRSTRSAEQAAALLQHFDVPLREPDLMIAIDQLPEGLSKSQFEKNYQNLNSDTYQLAVEKIDAELAQLRIYQ
ncbi:MAG: hypothetical protein V7752_14790 [Halopseudomonas sp.]